MDLNTLIFVVPTRNRPELARNAVRSLLDQGLRELRVVVSDNSTSPEAVAETVAFCNSVEGHNVTYIRPPEPLSMTRHYDWAIRQVLAYPHVSHVGLLTDRMIFRTGQFAGIVEVVRTHPQDIVTYSHDRLDDLAEPVTLEMHAWTGRTLALDSARLLHLSSMAMTHPSLPRMMNCIVPRAVFEALDRRYGNLFDSIAPDFNFCYRALEMCDRVVYYDALPLLHYALSRSNGESQARGVASKDHVDFIANLGGKTFNYATPVPGILTVGNAIMHEYCFVQQETGGSPKMPPVDRQKYLQQMAHEVEALENPELREQTRQLLAAEGWRGVAPLPPFLERFKAMSPGERWKRVPIFLRNRWRRLTNSPKLRRFWQWTARHLGFYPALDVVRIKFPNRATAIDFANSHARPKQNDLQILDYLQSDR